MSGLNSSLTCNYDVYGRLSRTSLSDASGYDVIYDDRGEVAAATVAGHSETHAYDFIGNEFDSNCLNQPEYSSSGVSVWYDANGRAIVHYVDAAMPALYLTYDAMHRLASASLLAEPHTLVQSNVYDNVGRRVMKYAPDGVHRYYYDDWLLRLETIEHDGVTDRVEYIWGKDISGTLGGAAGIGGLLYAKISDAIYVPQYDAYGNIIGYCDAAGNTVATYTYDAFGRTISSFGSLADVFAFRYSTKYFDRETGFYYYGKRYYSPALRRWLTRDPIEEEGGMNLYGFCENCPLLRYDSLGQSWLTCFGECVEEWRIDWGKVLTALNATASLNAPVSKATAERLWIEMGVSKDTTELSRAISQGQRLARKLPLGNPVRSRIVRSLGKVRRLMRNPALVKTGIAGAALTVFEGFYDIGTMAYCTAHCCGE